MSVADFSVVSFFAIAGAVPPALEVVKNTGSMWAKSPSSCMRCIRTEPTIPRQPTKPTNFIIFSLRLSYCFALCERLHYRLTHFFRAHFGGTCFVDVARAQALRQHALDRRLD